MRFGHFGPWKGHSGGGGGCCLGAFMMVYRGLGCGGAGGKLQYDYKRGLVVGASYSMITTRSPKEYH